ncbi:ATP synthase F1 subunit gamma [Reichenbachiella versicolor]|uniref:ATP synthase F1 subunit gamma n=1 Tax=Reichenbachiella versicolor TaxID=1821036 RepID=UPI000D6E40E3|nr:ATP synthase F1 subunit gamma [Reichenbachiella versicolor]
MANLKEVKERISSVTSTRQITSAMKMVAAAKLRRAQDKITQMRPYSQKLTSILQNVSANLDGDSSSQYSEIRPEPDNVLLVVVSSDRGLCGAFNNNAFKATVKLINEKYSYEYKHDGVHILPIGKKAYEYFSKRGYNVISDYYEIFSDLNFDAARDTAEFAMEGFLNRDFDVVEIIYNEFKNVATQILRTEQFLPIPESKEEVKSDDKNIDYIYEPSIEFVVEELIPKSLKIQFYKAILESNASEHGARMSAMDQATDNAGEMLKELKLVYNRTRQAAITKEILEIVGGAEALAAES